MKKFKKKYTKMLLDYTALCVGEEGRLQSLIRDGLPSLEKFACSIDTTRRQLDLWAGENRKFADAMGEAEERICDLITDAAAFKLIDPSFVKFLLGNKYGKNEEGVCHEPPFEINLTVVK